MICLEANGQRLNLSGYLHYCNGSPEVILDKIYQPFLPLNHRDGARPEPGLVAELRHYYQRAQRRTKSRNKRRRVRRVCNTVAGLKNSYYSRLVSSIFSNPFLAGPVSTCPFKSYRAPWQGQSQLFSALFHPTTHLAWVQTGFNAYTFPDSSL